MTHGFDSAKQHLGTQKSSTNCCHGRSIDSTAQTPPRDSQIIKELLGRVTHGFDTANSPQGLIYHQRTAGTGDAGIRHRLPLRTQKSSTNCCHGRHTNLTAQKPPRDSQIINELLARVTHGFDSAKRHLGTYKSSTNCCQGRRTDSTALNSTLGHINHQRTAVTGDAWI